MADFLKWTLSNPARAHEAIWAFVGLALGFVAALTILGREILHGIALLRRAKEEHLHKKPTPGLSPVDVPVPRRTIVVTHHHIYHQSGPTNSNRRNPKRSGRRPILPAVTPRAVDDQLRTRPRHGDNQSSYPAPISQRPLHEGDAQNLPLTDRQPA
jgi:hypothetical protein